jgi:hypothetical protein
VIASRLQPAIWGKAVVLVRRTAELVLVAVTFSLVSGCQYVGPIAIDQGRDRYNGVIQATSKEQTLSNIIRVRNHEPTSFMDVSEVDATTTLSGNVSGAITNIGAVAGTKSTSAGTISGQVGAVSGGAVYTEQPLIRYTPLLGQALVAQMVTPVSADALADLFDSGWNVAPLLDLGAAYLTPDITEFYPVLNILSELYAGRALAFAAAKSDLTKEQGATKTGQIGTLEVTTKSSSGGGNNDTLTIYLHPLHSYGSRIHLKYNKRHLQLWIRLLWLYSGTQPKFTPNDAPWCPQIGLSSRSESELRAWAWDPRLLDRSGLDPDHVLKCLPNFIELRTKPVPAAKALSDGLISGAPLLKTSSALGVLKAASERPTPKIAFVTPERYREITGYPWNKELDNSSFYTLLPQSEDPTDNPGVPEQINRDVSKWIANAQNLHVYDSKPGSIDDYLVRNYRLGTLRRYILIIVDDHAPGNAYVSHFDHGTWYYIDAADQISQRNFDLISLFLTMMAIPSALPPISPTISVGGG